MALAYTNQFCQLVAMSEKAPTHSLIRLLESAGTWQAFEADWRAQCEAYGEDFEQFAAASLPVLREQAADPDKDVGVYALQRDDGVFEAVAHAASSYIPGYQEKVLRVRHMLLSPNFDFGDYAMGDYSTVLARMVVRTIALAIGDLPSRHVKFHLRSPADREFFAASAEGISAHDAFYDVAIKGSWLHMSLRVGDAGVQEESKSG